MLSLLHEIFTIQLRLTLSMWWTFCYHTDDRSVWLNSLQLRLYARHVGRICILSIARYMPEQVSRFPLTWGLKASLSATRFPPAYDRARSALIYNDTACQLIHRFKFHNRHEIAALLAPWLQASGQDLLHDSDYLIPVPYICFASLVVVIIIRLNWRAGFRS